MWLLGLSPRCSKGFGAGQLPSLLKAIAVDWPVLVWVCQSPPMASVRRWGDGYDWALERCPYGRRRDRSVPFSKLMSACRREGASKVAASDWAAFGRPKACGVRDVGGS